jgi:DNA-binding GntR family transcriptional regulator
MPRSKKKLKVRRRVRPRAENIAAELIRLINDRELQPGDRVKEVELAERFRVSRGPVREALRYLAARAVLHIQPRLGATVARLSDEEVRELVEISGVLFGLAARRAAARIASAQMEKIAAEIEELAHMDGSEVSPRAFFECTRRIGARIVKVSAGAHLSRTLENCRIGAPDIFGHLGFLTHKRRLTAVLNWRAMLAALSAGDGAAAERIAIQMHDDAMQEATQHGVLSRV